MDGMKFVVSTDSRRMESKIMLVFSPIIVLNTSFVKYLLVSTPYSVQFASWNHIESRIEQSLKKGFCCLDLLGNESAGARFPDFQL